ncbi:MAG: histidine kinase, partial [Chlamydiota bacterium]
NWFFILSDLLWIALFYLNSFLLIPKLFYQKKYWLFAGLQITVLLIIMLLHNLFFYLLLGKPTFDLSIFFFYNLFPYLFILASSTSFQLIRDRINTDKLTKEKENETLKTELSLLRSQVSPHFMFNVLNNMVALARKHSELLEPSLIKLSSLMRYMLYETDEKKVSLEKEIDYLQSYIDLQQQRFGKNLQVAVSMPQADQPYEIEPMLLIPFVENAFKHGTGMIEKPTIDIELVAEKNVLRFCVRNKFNPASEELKDNTAGIGLTNVQRRLDLIYGPNHSLMINKKDDQFIISLQIFLAR